MKTISELEAELADLKAQEGHLWAKVQEQSRIVDELTKPWCQMGRRISETEMRIKLLKEMEAAQ